MEVTLEAYNREVLLEAFEELGWKIQQNVKVRGVADKCSHVAVNPTGYYDVGIEVNRLGDVALRYDSDLAHNPGELGKDFGVLKREYQALVGIKFAKAKQGKLLKKTRLAQDVVRLELELTI